LRQHRHARLRVQQQRADGAARYYHRGRPAEHPLRETFRAERIRLRAVVLCAPRPAGCGQCGNRLGLPL